MSFLRTMFGSGLTKDDPRAFLVEAMVGAIDADGEVHDSELAKLHEKLDQHEVFAGLTKDTKERLVDQAAEALESAGGAKNRIEAIGKGLHSRAERVIAYTLACEICVADNEMKESEIPYLEALQTALGLPDSEAQELFESVRKSSGIFTIEERVKRMQALMPRFIDAMVLLSLADGKVSDTEKETIATVLSHIADARSLGEKSLLDQVNESFNRLGSRNTQDVLNEICGVITSPTDRFWTLTYMMIIAVTDGAKDWQELGLLAQFQKAFGLDSKAMDSAMKIAVQFPNVRISGRVPT